MFSTCMLCFADGIKQRNRSACVTVMVPLSSVHSSALVFAWPIASSCMLHACVLHERLCGACVSLCVFPFWWALAACAWKPSMRSRACGACGFLCERRAYLDVTGGQRTKESGISAAESLESASAVILALFFHEKRRSGRFDRCFLTPRRNFRRCRTSAFAWLWAHAYFAEAAPPQQQSAEMDCLGYPAMLACRPFHSIETAASPSPISPPRSLARRLVVAAYGELVGLSESPFSAEWSCSTTQTHRHLHRRR